MFVIFLTTLLFIPGIFCSPACIDVTHSECSGYPEPIAEDTVPEYENCHILCKDYGPQCNFFIFDTDSGSKNCKIFQYRFKEFVDHCNIIGGPKKESGCNYDNPADNTCAVYRSGNCKYPQRQTKIIQTKGWETCQSACRVLDCQYWKFKRGEEECSLLKSAEKDCAWQFSPKSPSLEECDGTASTTTRPDVTTTSPDVTTTSPDVTTTNKQDTTITSTTAMPTTTSDPCYLPQSGSSSTNTVFKGTDGEAKMIFCEHISTEQEPCFMKNSNYQDASWLTVDPNFPFVLDCHGDVRPELTTLKDEKCGFKIGHVENVHGGEWTCGSMRQDGSSVEVVSTATLCVQKSCNNMVEFSDICGCFDFSFKDSEMSWGNAQKECKKKNGNLVTLDSLSKQTTIFEHWDGLDIYVNPWIGAHKDGGEWKWASNGETIPDEESEDPFANWDWGQPDYGDCAYMAKLGYGAWSSDDCKYEAPFICEI